MNSCVIVSLYKRSGKVTSYHSPQSANKMKKSHFGCKDTQNFHNTQVFE